MLRIDSIEFVACAALLVVALRLLPAPRARAFYAATSGLAYVALAPNLASVALALAFVYGPWLVLRLPTRPRWWIPALFVVQVALLLWARKYLAMFPTLAAVPFVSHAFLILGASYVILRQVELVLWVDANPEARVSFVEYTSFTIGFFTLLAGPIISFRDFQAGFVTSATVSRRALALALNRIVNGYIKVSLIGPVLYELSTLETLQNLDFGLGSRLAFFYLYPWYIYMNFAGYCDVVIGFGKLAKFEIPENFDKPFLATNIQNYWQRWHITFAQWIRNYLFFPMVRGLRGSKLRPLRAAAMPVAVLASFVVVGLWHGTDPGLAVFGALHGLAVVAVAPYASVLRGLLGDRGMAFYETSRVVRAARVFVCYNYLCFTLLFFERPFAVIWPLLVGS